MRLRWLLGLTLGLLMGVSGAWGQDNVKFFPIDQIKAGLKGTGRTVFEGDKIEDFQVEILGVLKNAIAPKQDLILARLSGGPLAETGVIAGMSGSPVYIDGKLVGAVALGFPFSKEPIAGITPIEQMMRVVPEHSNRAAPEGPTTIEAEAGPPGSGRDESGGFTVERGGSGEREGRAADLWNARSAPPGASSGLEGGTGYRVIRGPGGSLETARLVPLEAPGPDTPEAPWPLEPSLTPDAAPGGSLSPVSLALPLRFGGFSSQLIQSYAPVFRSMGFEPMAGGILSGGPADEPAKGGDSPGKAAAESEASQLAQVKAGSMISLFLVRGDLNLNADCTVTLRQGNDLYACGHRLLLAGPSEIPFARSSVLTTVSSLASSFKLDSPADTALGSIRQDRFSAIYGVLGEKADLIPVHLHLDSTLNTQADYNFELVQDAFLSPFLLNLAVVSTLSSTERMVGPSTLEITGKLKLSSGDSINIDDVVSAEMSAPTTAGMAVAMPLSYVLASGFPDLSVKGVDLSVVAINQMRQATVEEVWSTKSEVRPGDRIEVTAVLRTPSGERVTTKIPVTIPDSVTDKTLSLVVGSGQTINALENRLSPLSTPPRDVRQLVRVLNRMRRNNRVYALLMAPQRSLVIQGDEYPSPPPSLVQTLMADPGASSNMAFSGTSMVGDFETKASPYTIRGEKTLMLKVVGGGG